MWRSIISAERISEPGLTLSWPAYFGAVPWVPEHGHRIGQVGAGRDADAADLGRQGVGEIVAVQVQGWRSRRTRRGAAGSAATWRRRSRPDHDVLSVRILELHPRTAVQQLGAEFIARDFVAPILKAPSVNFMMPLCTRVTELRSLSTAYCRALRTRRLVPSWETGLMPMPQFSGEADLLDAHFLGEELDDLQPPANRPSTRRRHRCPGVLAEDHHVHVARLFTGLGTPSNQRTGRWQT